MVAEVLLHVRTSHGDYTILCPWEATPFMKRAAGLPPAHTRRFRVGGQPMLFEAHRLDMPFLASRDYEAGVAVAAWPTCLR